MEKYEKEFANKIIKLLEEHIKKIEQRLFEKIDLSKAYTEWLKTGEAAKMLKIHKTTLIKRKNSSKYKENRHFKRSGSIILWNRDALLKEQK